MSNELMVDLSKGPGAWLMVPEVRSRITSAVSGWMDGEFFLSQILISLTDPKLDDCTGKSKFKAAHDCAALGLLPTMHQVALIPRWVRPKREDKAQFQPYRVVDVMPQWQGYKAIMERNPEVLDVSAHIIHVRDQYEVYTGGVIEHNFDPFDTDRVINGVKNIRGGYAVITFRNGRPPVYFPVRADYIDKCRKCAESQAIWNSWPEQQILKTILRACYARRAVNVDPVVGRRLEQLMQHEDALLGNDPLRSQRRRVSVVKPLQLGHQAETPQLPHEEDVVHEDVPMDGEELFDKTETAQEAGQ